MALDHCLVISMSVVILKSSNNMEQFTLNFSASSGLQDDFYMYLGTELCLTIYNPILSSPSRN